MGIIFEVWATLRLFKDTLLRKKIINVKSTLTTSRKRKGYCFAEISRAYARAYVSINSENTKGKFP